MGGLEVSEVLFSHLDLGDRFDAEFFTKSDLSIEQILTNRNAVELRTLGRVVASAFYPSATHLYEFGEMPFIRCVDCVDFPLITQFQDNLFEKLPISFIKEQKGINLLNRNDIVITKVGTPCYASIIYEHEEVALSRTVLGIKNIKKVNPFYLLSFLRSKYGFSQLQRHRELTIQYQLTLERTKRVLIYLANEDIQQEVANLARFSIDKLSLSREAYQTAQNLLLEHLDLKDFNPPTQTVNIKSFADSFGTSGRLDAEFYQEKYESYLKKIQAYPNGCELIRTACKLKYANYTPKDNQTYRYIELSNIGNSGEITGASLDLGCNLPSRARRKVSKNDVIVSSIEGSLASCAIISEQYHQALCSTGFYVVSSKKINSETLLMLFKSEPIQQLLKQGCSGTILTAINKDEFLNIPLPLVDANIQTQIADLIRQSDRLRQESQALLEEAKRKVEQAIEG